MDIKIISHGIYQQFLWHLSISLEKAVVDIAKLGLNNEHLNILYNANCDIKMAIKGENVNSVETLLTSSVLQGDTYGPQLATAQVDEISTYWEETAGDDLYKYKDEVGLGLAGMVDDLIGFTSGPTSTVILNTVLNAKAAEKGLQFGPDKCVIMTVKSKKNKNAIEPEAKVDLWTTKYDDDTLMEELEGKVHIKTVNVQKYLGTMISNDGSNEHTMKAKSIKSLIAKDTIMAKLNSLPLGRFYFEVAIDLRESILLGQLLYATEALTNIKKSDMDILVKADEDYILQVMNLERTAPRALVYLELGLTTISMKIKMRRIMYYQYILKQEEKSLLQRMLKAQERNPTKNDWILEVRKDLEELKINLNDEEIKKKTKEEFKRIVKRNGKEESFRQLKEKAGIDLPPEEKPTKAKGLKYKEMKMAHYLTAGNAITSIEAKEDAFKARIKMTLTAKNFPNRFGGRECRLGCKNIEEDYSHILKCEASDEKYIIKEEDIEELYGENTEKINKISMIINKAVKERNERIVMKKEREKRD